MVIKVEEKTRQERFLYQWSGVAICLFLLGSYLFVECALSLVQWMRYQKQLKPYHVTPVLRPIIRIFTEGDLLPRTRVMPYTVPWDYTTDRLKPGRYKGDNGLSFYTVNSYGIRGKEFSMPKPSDTFRVVVFGGSTTIGVESPDDQTYPAVLEDLLNVEQTESMVEVLNYGMGSKSLYYILRHLLLELDKLDADVVMINSIRNTWFYDQNQDLFDYSDIVPREQHYAIRLSKFFDDNVLFYRFMKRTYEEIRRTWLDRKIAVYKNVGVKYDRHYLEVLHYQTLEIIYKFVRERGVALVLILEPLCLDEAEQLRYKKLSNSQLFDILENTSNLSENSGNIILSTILYNNIYRLQESYPDILIVDPIKEFLHQAKLRGKDILFRDYIHLSPEGNKLLAEIIVEDVEQRSSSIFDLRK